MTRDTSNGTSGRKASEIIAAIRHQLEINVRIVERDHPEAPLVDGRRDAGHPHSQDLLAQHIRDQLSELEAVLGATSPEVSGTAAIHAHTVRKAASRAEEEGEAHLAEELREAMRFIEQSTPAADVVESAKKDGYAQALAVYRPTKLLSAMQDAAMQADAALRAGVEHHMARTLEAISESLLAAASLRGAYVPHSAVIPLVWTEIEGRFRASTITGIYEVMPHGSRWVATGLTGGSSVFATSDEAKAAAQEDFEGRVRSVVDSVPSSGLDILAQARRAHLEAVEAYNRRLKLVRAERECGDHSSNVDAEYRTMTEAQNAFIRTAQEVADAAAGISAHG